MEGLAIMSLSTVELHFYIYGVFLKNEQYPPALLVKMLLSVDKGVLYLKGMILELEYVNVEGKMYNSILNDK